MIKTKKQTNQQTNKKQTQTNNHFLDPKYLSQIKSDLHKNFRVTSCGCPKIIKINKTNKSINKQTNKYTFLDPKYLCQIKSDLHKNFRVTSCGSPMMIKTKTNKSINKQTNEQF